MPILILSDIHANLTALNAVLDAAGDWDAVWCLGDLIGYGPDANEVVERLRALPNFHAISGNHDLAIADLSFDISQFNIYARRSVEFSRRTLSEENREYLLSLATVSSVKDGVTLAHGSPRDSIWEYILVPSVASRNFKIMATDLAFVGHTHVQGCFEQRRTSLGSRVRFFVPELDSPLPLHDRRLILNPGSVGQPRDDDPRAAFAVYDPESETWAPHRVGYDVPAVQERMRKLGLPERHITRLAEGW